MTGSLFRRLLVMALALVAATLFAVDYTFTTYVAHLHATGFDLEAVQVRNRILAISLGEEHARRLA